MLLDHGLVLMADTRTNAGVDNFSTFRKLHVLRDDADRQIYVATAGSLSISQTVLGLLREDEPASLDDAPSMFRVAQTIGEAVAQTGRTIGAALAEAHIDSSVELLVGGRVGSGPLELFLIYAIGNFIACTPDVPFMQIGETKYGRPILDRALRYDTPLADAVKVGCLSFDSTMKSNLGVAQPIDVLALSADSKRRPVTRRIERGDPYFRDIAERWGQVLYEAAVRLPNPPWIAEL